MENHETKSGILALIDIVNFTGQATQLGEKFTAQYSQYFQNTINSMVTKHEFRVIKFLGDAALIFGQEPGKLLEIMLDLFERRKPGDKYGFISRFRLVAHFGFFQFQMKNRQPIDLVSPEGIKVFRMEKYAAAGELMVTRELYQGLKPLLTSRNIEARRLTLEESLKGFSGEEWFPPFYKLKIARKESGAANLLEQRLEELEREVEFITVFGNMYPPVPMAKNFINLSILCDEDNEPGFACDKFQDDDEIVKSETPIKGKRIGAEDDWIFIEKLERRHRRDFNEIDVDTLYENKGNRYTNGVIFGLPGAGEYVFIHSTIMEYLAAFHLVRQARKDKENLPGLVQTALEKQEFLGLETIPIAAGNDLLKGFAILAVIRDLQPDYGRDLLEEMGIKCLAEVEWQITKTFQGLRIEGLRKNILDIIRQHRASLDWVYEVLKKLVLNHYKESIKENIQRFAAFTRLSRDTLLEEHLDYEAFDEGDTELVNLRKQLLLELVQKELVEQWILKQEKSKPNREAVEEYACVLQLDTPGYHPEDRNFKYFQSIIGRELVGFLGSPNMRHHARVFACAFSPDGKRFVSASEDGTLKLWDAASGKDIRTLDGHKRSVTSCAFSPQGSQILSASYDKTLKLWDAASGKCLKTIHLPWIPFYVAFSPQFPYLAATANQNGTLTLFDWR